MNLGWTLKRLRSMEPAEIVHRLGERRRMRSLRQHEGWPRYAARPLRPVFPNWGARIGSATPQQREALFNIMSGKHSAEGTLFHIFSLIVTKIHDPLFVPFEFSFDRDGRVARVVAKGVLETEVEPIKNPVTGQPHRIQVVMPEGFEHRAAEVASAKIRSSGAIKFETQGTHSSLANVVQTPEGVAA